MRDYGKVHSSFWSSATIRSMSDDGKVLALYLMTSTHTTIAGVFRLPDGYACEDIGWTSQRVRKAFEDLAAAGFAFRCEDTKWVWIVKHIDWNPPENPNQRKAAAKCASQIPRECGWLSQFVMRFGSLLELSFEGLANGSETVVELSATLSKPFRNQKQEQEQKQEQKQKTRRRDLPPDFTISDRVKDWAREHGHSQLEKRFEQFVGYVKRSGKQYADWDEAFMGAVREDWAKLGKPVQASGDALEAWMAQTGHGGMQ